MIVQQLELFASSKLKIHADQMVVKTLYQEGDEERG
jgi:hypothetical protein